MFLLVLAICAVGVLQIFSATHATIFQDAWWKQIVYIGAGIVLMLIMTATDYHALMQRVYPIYIGSIVLLIGGGCSTRQPSSSRPARTRSSWM